MNTDYQIAVIGAGPAGMAAATTAAEAGARVLIVDEQPAPGGQIYRNIETADKAGETVLGADYAYGRKLTDALRASTAECVSGATVWQVSPEREIGLSVAGAARMITADAVIIATGAQERPFPLPGWALPGVMTAGAAQIALKAHGLTAADAVFVGTGPLLYLIAYQYLQAGVPVRAIIDTTPWHRYVTALPHLPGAMLNLGPLIKGLGYLRALRAAGVPFIRGASDLRIVGAEIAEAIRYEHSGHQHEITTPHVFLHQGVVPSVNLTRASGCDHRWDDAQRCWRVTTDDWGETSIDGIFAAGDGSHIGGALAAEHRGHLAALGALHRIGRLDAAVRNNRAAPVRHILAQAMYLRPFLDALYRPAKAHLVPTDDATVVCRCEEVTAGEIRDIARIGCAGPNQLKSFCRAGMGPCQGRLCALTVTEMLAELNGFSHEEIGDYRRRPPVKPLTVGELADLAGPGS